MRRSQILWCVPLIVLLVLGGITTAWACASAATTLPDASGAVTCQGQNPTGTAATWTIGGSIYYNAGAGQHGSTGWGHYWPCASGNPNIREPVPTSTSPTNPCGWTLRTSSNVTACPISVRAYFAYVPYPGPGTVVTTLSNFTGVLNGGMRVQSASGFSDLHDVKNVQYKCEASQGAPLPAGAWVAATPYL